MGCLLEGGGRCGRVGVGAVVLAAGSGSRIGHRPKCLLELGGVPLIRRLLVALSEAGVAEIVVVTGHHAEFIEPLVQHGPATLVRNPDPDAGLVSSQRLGLAALMRVPRAGLRSARPPRGTRKLGAARRFLESKPAAVIVALADQPLIDAQDIAALLGAWNNRPEGAQVVYPEVVEQPAPRPMSSSSCGAQGQAGETGPRRERGNPVVLSAEVCEQILAGAADFGCRQWQAAHPAQVAPFVTVNRRYRMDIDTPEDLARFERETGHVLRWPASVPA